MWNLPRPGIEPMPLASAGRFLSTVPPEKSLKAHFYYHLPKVYSHFPSPSEHIYSLQDGPVGMAEAPEAGRLGSHPNFALHWEGANQQSHF